jgi:integrase/recombinase XerD
VARPRRPARDGSRARRGRAGKRLGWRRDPGTGLTTLAAAVDGYLAHVAVERGLSPHTVAAYRRDLARYAAWCEARGLVDIDEIAENDVADFVASLRSGTPDAAAVSASSAARVTVAVRSFHKFAAVDGLAHGDPARHVRPSRIPRRLPKALPYDDVARLLAAAGNDETPDGLRDRALVELLYGTGTRVSEAVGLDVDDLDLIGQTVIVTGKGNKQRLLPLGGPAVEALEAYLVRGRPALASRGRGTPKVFVNALGRPLSRQSAYGVLRHTAERAQLTATIGPHTLRHSYATHLLENGADVRVVQELLGHASVTTTQIYTMVTVDTLRQVYATSHPRAR